MADQSRARLDAAAAHAALGSALRALALKPGQTIYLGLDLGGIALPAHPPPRDRAAMRELRDASCAFIHAVLHEIVGEAGTILAPAFSYDYARRGTPYEHETSPAETGPFTEWFRQQPGVIRSFHPLFSVCGEGPRVKAILEDCGRSAFGPASPFGRLIEHEALFVGLGLHLPAWLTFAHHLEQLAGVSHAYHKLFTVPVKRNGRAVPGPWLAFVRHLGAGVDIDLRALEKRLVDERALRQSEGEAGLIQVFSAADCARIGLAMLKDDPFAFIGKPVGIHIDAAGGFVQPDGPWPATRFAPK